MLYIIQNDPEVPPGNIAENPEVLGIVYVVHHPYRAATQIMRANFTGTAGLLRVS